MSGKGMEMAMLDQVFPHPKPATREQHLFLQYNLYTMIIH